MTALLLLEVACTGGGSNQTSGSPAPSGAQTRGGDLRMANISDVVTLDATKAFDNESIYASEAMYETLVTSTPDGQHVEPWLASSWDTSSDNMSLTFHLRPGLKFSNGQVVTAADSKFAIDQCRSPQSGWSFLDAAIASVEAPDASTVVVTTKEPWAPLLADLSVFCNGVVPSNYGGAPKRDFYQHPIGTGPFMFGTWKKGESLQLVRNPNYWQQGKPYLDSVTWTNVTNDNTRSVQLKGGQINIDQYPPFSQINDLKTSPGINVGVFDSTRVQYIWFNLLRAPYSDVHVRRAIALALDPSSFVKAITFEYGKIADSDLPPSLPYYHSIGAAYNLTMARQELAQSSVPNGFSTTFMVGSGSQTESLLAQIVQQALKPLGINVQLQIIDPSAETDNLVNGKFDMGTIYLTSDIADPDEDVTATIVKGFGIPGYHPANFVNLAHEADLTFDKTKRAQLYTEIQQIWAQDRPDVPLFYTPFVYAMSDAVQGFHVSPLGIYHLEDVWLSA